MTVYTVWNGGLPPSPTSTSTGQRNDSTVFTVSKPCILSRIGFYCPSGETNLTGSNYTATLYSTTTGTSGTQIAQVVGSGTFTAGAWNWISFSPTLLSTGVTYVAAVNFPSTLEFQSSYWGAEPQHTSGVTSGVLHVPPQSSAPGGISQGFLSGAVAFPSSTNSPGTWYGVDVEVIVVDGTADVTMKKMTVSGSGCASSLYGAYAFDEGSGSTITDYSGNGHDMTIVGSNSWVTGQGSYANAFQSGPTSSDGAYYDHGSADSILSADVTVMMWYKHTGATGTSQCHVGGIYSAPGTARLSVWSYRNRSGISSAPHVTTRDSSATISDVGVNSTTADTNWHHAAVVYHANGLIEEYLDGSLVTSATPTANPIGSNSRYIGVGDFLSIASSVEAQAQDLRVFSGALNAAKITEYMDTPVHATSGVTGTGAVTLKKMTVSPVLNVNTGFESGTNPWLANGANAVLSQDSSWASAGTNSAQVSVTASSDFPGMVSEDLDVSGNQTYVYQATVESPSAYDVQVGIHWYDSGRSFIASTYDEKTLSPGVGQAFGPNLVTSPSDAAIAVIFCQVDGTVTSGVAFNVDEISLETVSGSPIQFAAVGSLQDAENSVSGTSTTFSLTTTTIGDFVLASIANGDTGTPGQQVSGVSSARCTWRQLASADSLDTDFFVSIWIGTVESVGSDTVTVTYASSMGGASSRFNAREFESFTGGAVLDTYGTVDHSGGTSSWATLVPSRTNELYWGWCEDFGSATAGSTSGFVYESDSHGNGSGYDLNVSSSYTPVWGDSGMVAGLMVLVSGSDSGTGAVTFKKMTVDASGSGSGGSSTQTLFGQADPGVSATSNDSNPYTLAMQFVLSQDAPLTGIWFYSAADAAGLPAGCGILNLDTSAVVSGTENDSATWSGSTAGSGWVKQVYDGSITLTAGVNYAVAVLKQPAFNNVYSATPHYWDSTGAGNNGLTNGIIHAPNSAGSLHGQDTFFSGGSTLNIPNTDFNASNYWIDVEVGVSGSGASGTAAVTLKKMTTSGSGHAQLVGTGEVTLKKMTASGSGHARLVATGAVTLKKMVVSAFGSEKVFGVIAVTMNKMEIHGTNIPVRKASSLFIFSFR